MRVETIVRSNVCEKQTKKKCKKSAPPKKNKK
jgi:hypothetical protein